MYIACVLIDHFPSKIEATRNFDLEKQRIIVFQKNDPNRTVLDDSLSNQYTAYQASDKNIQESNKNTVLVGGDISEYQQIFDRIMLSLGKISPILDTPKLGHAYICIDGLKDMYGGEARLISNLLQTIPPYLKPRLGISEGKFPAYLAATYAEPGNSYKPDAKIKEFMSAFPVDVLPISSEIKTRLHEFGLHTLGKLASLPLGPVQAQFSKTGNRIWHLAHGIDTTPMLTSSPKNEVSESVILPIPITRFDHLMTSIKTLLDKIFANPDVQGRLVRTAILEGHISNKTSWIHRFIFKSPIREKINAYQIIETLLINTSISGPFDEIHLTFKNFTGEASSQKNFFHDMSHKNKLRESIESLKASQGRNPIYQIREVEPWSRIPERQKALTSYDP